jgi:hypothetical protein
VPENWPREVGNRLQRMAEAWVVRSPGFAAGSGDTEYSSTNHSGAAKSGRAACDPALGPDYNRRTAIDSRSATSSIGLPLRIMSNSDKTDATVGMSTLQGYNSQTLDKWNWHGQRLT